MSRLERLRNESAKPRQLAWRLRQTKPDNYASLRMPLRPAVRTDRDLVVSSPRLAFRVGEVSHDRFFESSYRLESEHHANSRPIVHFVELTRFRRLFGDRSRVPRLPITIDGFAVLSSGFPGIRLDLRWNDILEGPRSAS